MRREVLHQTRRVREDLRGEAAQGRCEDHRRCGAVAGVLRLPSEHWIHLRTTNPVESTFSTVTLRTKVTRGAGSPAAALAMVFKLVESAQDRWRAITGAHLVAPVRSGAKFENGVLVERSEKIAA